MSKLNFNQLNFENIEEWSNGIKYLFVVMWSVCLVGLGYWFMIQPNQDKYRTMVEQEKILRVQFEQKQRQAAQLSAYQKQFYQVKNSFGQMSKQLPTQKEMPELFEDISKTGIASGLIFQLFAPQPGARHDFYRKIPINLAVVGSYQQFSEFVSRIAQMKRIITLHDFKIIPYREDSLQTMGRAVAAQAELLMMTMVISVYWARDSERMDQFNSVVS